MIPFLKVKKADGGIATQYRAPDEGKEPESKDDQGMMAAMKEFSDALVMKDHKAMAAAFRNAFDMLEMEPHDEIEHDNE